MPMNGGGSGSAQKQVLDHIQSSQMAHAAARKAGLSRVLGGGANVGPIGGASLSGGAPAVPQPANPAGPASLGAPPAATGWKHQVAQHAAGMGIPMNVKDIHAAVDGMTAMGHLSPGQGSALKAHNGPLMGSIGHNVMASVLDHAMNNQNPNVGQ